MAASNQRVVDEHGRVTITVSTTGGTNGDVYVGNLREVCIGVRRVSGSSDTASVQGSLDGTNFATVTSKEQTTGGIDTVMTGITSLAFRQLRQTVNWLRLVSSGTTDPLEMVVSGIPIRS